MPKFFGKETAFFVIHDHFRDTVVDHYNQGLNITRYWAELNICHEEKLSNGALFKFSNFEDNRYIKKFLVKLFPEEFSS